MKHIWQQDLIEWYLKNKRDLPWRNTKDPYKIWLSEIILQQTRVVQGMPYYERFVERFPTIKDLAEADIDSVLKLWQGLGYYSRARNLHECAGQIINNFNGKFPENHGDILGLKGIGAYTAAAIFSFAYNGAYPVLDGNVFRVLSRLFNIDKPINSTEGKKLFENLSLEVMYTADPANYNQAIMEFGAMVCKPQNPDCKNCILRIRCEAYKNNTVNDLPVKLKKTKQRERFLNYLIIRNGDKVFWTKRNDKDIWKGLYEFPVFETGKAINKEEGEVSILDLFEQNKINKNGISLELLYETKHILTHQKIFAKFWNVKYSGKNSFQFKNSSIFEISVYEIDQYGVASITEKFLKTNKL